MWNFALLALEMSETYFEDKTFEGMDFTDGGLSGGEYENCTFNNCRFVNGDLSGITFSECKFINCDLSMAKIVNTALREITFKGCKLLGLHFDDCNGFLFSVKFQGCQLHLASFYQRSLKGTLLEDCNLQEVDFAEADLTGVIFSNCDLSGAIFQNTTMEKADFRTAYNYSIDPERNRIKKAKFSRMGLVGLLDKYGLIIE